MKGPVSIKTFTVTKAGQWVWFEVAIPRRSPAICGVNFTVSGWAASWGFRSGPYTPSIAGEVRLRWQEQGDVFFAAPVDHEEALIHDGATVGAPHIPVGLNKGMWDFGRRKEPHRVQIARENTMVFGLYRDNLIAESGVIQDYTVKVYLYFEQMKGGPK